MDNLLKNSKNIGMKGLYQKATYMDILGERYIRIVYLAICVFLRDIGLKIVYLLKLFGLWQKKYIQFTTLFMNIQ